MNWYIGQKVVCIDAKQYINASHPACEVLIEGKTYTIQGLKKGCCTVLIDVGIANNTNVCESICIYCSKSTENKSGKRYFASERFRPLEDNFAERVLSEAIESAKEVEILIETYKEEKV